MIGKILILATVLALSVASFSLAQGNIPQVEISNIVSDETISGKVSNIPPTQAGQPCAAVYVHTDVWYLHPYATGGIDKSYALVDAQGNWSIPTVKRDFPANQVAVVVMSDTTKCDDLPARIADVRKITNTIVKRTYDLKKEKPEWYSKL